MKIILICSICLSSCARIKEMNKPEENTEFSSKIHFKKAKITLKNKRQIESENVYYDNAIKSIVINQKNNPRAFNIDEVQTLRYSNKNAAGYGALIGGIAGFAIPITLLGKEGAKGSPLGAPSEISITVVISIISTLVGLGIGYNIGSGIYFDWQDYPLNGNESVPLPVFNSPPSKTMFLRWNIPLHRLKPF